jgi:anaerobic magnesium-protoporphyrin IX monomethyl ester cyclase
VDEITLINLPSPFLHDPLVMPPLGLCYVSSVLKHADINVRFLDMAEHQTVTVPRTKYYAMGCTTPQFHFACHQLKWLKENHDNPIVCIGGPHATLRPQECLDAGFDAVIVGEAERAIFDFINGRNGIIAKHDIQKLDYIPFPDRNIIQDYDYRIDGLKATTMMTSRGCPYVCAFCCNTWNQCRFRSADNVLQEVKNLHEQGYQAIQFYDDEFLIKKIRDLGIMRGLKELGLKWRCFTRADLIDYNMAMIMADHGCHEVLIGIESGSDDILNAINKGTTVTQNERAIHCLYNAGINVKAAMIVGLPGESPRTLMQTMRFCCRVETEVSEWDFTHFIPYPGSRIYHFAEEYDITFNKNDVYAPYKGGDWQAIVSTSTLSREELTDARNTLHETFKGAVY